MLYRSPQQEASGLSVEFRGTAPSWHSESPLLLLPPPLLLRKQPLRRLHEKLLHLRQSHQLLFPLPLLLLRRHRRPELPPPAPPSHRLQRSPYHLLTLPLFLFPRQRRLPTTRMPRLHRFLDHLLFLPSRARMLICCFSARLLCLSAAC